MTIDTAGLRELIWQVENLGEHKAEAEPILRHWEQWLPALLDRVQVLEKAMTLGWTIEHQDVAKALVKAVQHCDLGPGDDPDVMLQLYDLIPEEWCAPDRTQATSDIAENIAFAALDAWLHAARQSLPTKDVG